ncbi:hypothetical protein [Cohaesibacter marisflavi]|uniref:hypothetical protein n=1 Tax=Cohaesibacter marisflavi TaxID=655353 RepID=UPI0029C95CBA|nr:hypothetical protein [Cohaesibacter marisflavi]
MSDDRKVIALNGGPVPQAGQIQKDVIDRLEGLLSCARSGDLQGFACVAYHAEDKCSRWRAGSQGGYAMLGALKVLSEEMIELIREE